MEISPLISKPSSNNIETMLILAWNSSNIKKCFLVNYGCTWLGLTRAPVPPPDEVPRGKPGPDAMVTIVRAPNPHPCVRVTWGEGLMEIGGTQKILKIWVRNIRKNAECTHTYSKLIKIGYFQFSSDKF